jgi:hypothetical protein
MALTVNQAVTRVRSMINESVSASFWSDTEIEAWLEDGTRLFSSRSGLVEDDQPITLVANQLNYGIGDETWIGDCLELQTAIYINGTTYKGLIIVDPRAIGNLLTKNSGAPKYIAQQGREIYIWPLTSSTIAGATVQCLYSKETDDFTAIQDEYQGYVIEYATAMALRKDRQYAKSGALLAEFYGNIDYEKQFKFHRTIDTVQDFKIPKGQPR